MSDLICPDCGATTHYGVTHPFCKARVEIGSPTRERMDIEYPDTHVKMEGKKIGTILGKFYPESMDGLALQHPTLEQIDYDIIGELSRLRQKVADLETAKEFNAHIHDNITKRLNEAEDKLEAIEEQFLHFIELRKIKGHG